jgi:hypothetical protein
MSAGAVRINNVGTGEKADAASKHDNVLALPDGLEV